TKYVIIIMSLLQKLDFPFLPCTYCNRTWDGWLCWDDTPAGIYTSQNCPNYFPDFDSTGTIHSFVI
uniref:G-protein coupled receptors family 2 profile 1 domain-containing protein n=1 Tax=Sinocyclocheilus anshuiensis TaxID=1608454 RepID=A0A671REY5_9TELE